jgi:predicted MFS family arabinose efflux permease
MALLALSTFAGASTIHYQTPMLGAFALEFGADASAAGWVATLTFGGFFAGFLFIVPLGDRFDKRPVILAQIAILVVALFGAAAAPNLAMLAATSFAIGLCGGFAQSIVPLVVELSRREERGRTLGTLLSSLFLGILFGRLAGGFVAAHFGWRWMYVFAGTMLAVVGLLLAARLPSVAPKTALSYRQLMVSMLELVRAHAQIRRIAAVHLLLGLCYGGFWATLAPMLQSAHGLGPGAAGLMAIPGAAGILISRWAGRLLDRQGAWPVVTTGVALVMVAYLVLGLGLWWVAAVVTGAIFLDCGLRAAMVANQTVMNSLSPNARSRSNTIFGVNVWGGNAAGALVASSALAQGGWLAVCAMGLLAALGALAVQLLARRE